GRARGLVGGGRRGDAAHGPNGDPLRGGGGLRGPLRRGAPGGGRPRIRFTTSHPHDLSDELIAVFAEEPKVMPHFHLPVQSGSDAVLVRMRRSYTVDWYLDRLEKLRAARPGIAITTDIIVGFPGETDEAFQKTLDLVERVRYENAYSFIYSPRPRTAAARHMHEWGVVPRETAVARLVRLQARLREHSLEYYA